MFCSICLGKGNPKYEYQHVEGNFRATLHLPGIDIGISSDPAPTKKAVSSGDVQLDDKEQGALSAARIYIVDIF